MFRTFSFFFKISIIKDNEIILFNFHYAIRSKVLILSFNFDKKSSILIKRSTKFKIFVVTAPNKSRVVLNAGIGPLICPATFIPGLDLIVA